jgi:hypothetical protein
VPVAAAVTVPLPSIHQNALVLRGLALIPS